MSRSFEELDFRPTPMGALSLRRRRRPMSDVDVYEIKLGDEFLMSSQFTAAEIELARLGLAALGRGDLDVVVGGLGLGYTARAVLENPDVRSLIVVDALAEVIEWHEQGLLPLGRELTADPRCRLVNGDFFAMSSSVEGFDNSSQGRRFDAVLVDIDRHANCCIRATPRCTSRRGWPGSPAICTREASSRCGRTMLPMTPLNASWPKPLQPTHPMS
jgi:hypothetical protein